MTRLLVEIDDFVDAARTLDERVGDPIDTAVARLSSALAGAGGMAGDDPPARDWGRGYDEAALSTLRATSRLAAAAYATSAMLGRSALNYARAEAASTAGGATTAPALSRLPGGPVLVPAPVPPGSVGGGGGGEPTGWGLVKDLVGYVWPNGHQDRLRSAATAHRRCADALADTDIAPASAGVGFARDRLPEADDILTVCQGLTDRIRELASAHRALARMCDEFAHRLDECHSEVESELAELGIESGVIQGIGAGLSLVTFGGAELPTQGVQAARLAAVAARVGELIANCGTAVRALADSLPEISAVGDRIARSLEWFSGSRLAVAGVTDVGRLQRVGRLSMEAREAAATGRLARNSRRILQTPKRMIGRKPGDPGVWGDKAYLARHFSKHGAEVGARSEEEYVSKASDLLERGIRGEVPVKVDTDGTIRVFDPTSGDFGSFRPDGGTRTFFHPPGRPYFDRQPGVLQ